MKPICSARDSLPPSAVGSFVDEAEVAVAAGLRHRGLAGIDARPQFRFLVDHRLDAGGVTGHVTHGGEPAQQRVLGPGQGGGGQLRL